MTTLERTAHIEQHYYFFCWLVINEAQKSSPTKNGKKKFLSNSFQFLPVVDREAGFFFVVFV